MAAERAVLLMAYGGPDTLEDVEPFLADIRGGRPTSPELVEEIRERYAQIGGGSPLLAVTRRQAAALEERLAQEAGSDRFRVFVGMRHWRPWIRDTVAEIADAGLRRGVALCLAPHYSRMSIGAYFARLDEALSDAGAAIDFARVPSWHLEEGFLDAVAAEVRRSLAAFSPDERATLRVLFTAHSLPTRILEQGDPYPDQLLATAEAVAGRLGEAIDWSFCFQSAGASSIPWLGPAIEEEIPRLAAEGHRHLLVVPIGFVADHVEVLFDLDIEAKQIAAEAGVRLERTASMNDTPAFIDALAQVVLKAEAEPADRRADPSVAAPV